MGVGIKIEVTDQATPVCEATADLLAHPKRLHTAAGAYALALVKERFQALSKTNHNKLGAPSSGFWDRMMGGTRMQATDTEAVVYVPREAVFRYHGGTVTPKVAKYLTIPIVPEAYNKSIRQFDNIAFAKIGGVLFAYQKTPKVDTTPGQHPVSAKLAAARARSTAGTLQPKSNPIVKGPARVFLYCLKESATVAGNTEVFPPEEELRASAKRGVDLLVNTTIAQAKKKAANQTP